MRKGLGLNLAHRILTTGLCRDGPHEVENHELDSVIERVGLEGSGHLWSCHFEASTVLNIPTI